MKKSVRKSVKRFAEVLRFVLTFTLVFSILTSGIVAVNVWGVDENPKYVSVAGGSVSGERGSSVTIPVVVANNPGVVFITLKVKYDDGSFELESAVSTDNILGTKFLVEKSENLTGSSYSMMWDNSTGDNSAGNGVLANFTFKIKDTASTGNHPIEITVNDFFGKDEVQLKPDITNGSITVLSTVPPSPVVDDISINFPNETIHAPKGDTYQYAQTQEATIWTDFTDSGISISSVIKDTPQSIYVRKAASGDNSPSKAISFDIPARPSSPNTLEVDKTDDTSITLKPIENAVYSIDGGDWVSSNVFTGLTKGTEYTFTAQYKATDKAFKSSTVTRKFTVGNILLTGTVTIEGKPEYNGSLTAKSNLPSGAGDLVYKWYRDTTPIEGLQAEVYFAKEHDVGHNLSVEVSAKSGGFTGFVKSESVLIDKSTPPNVTFPTANTIKYGAKLSSAKWAKNGVGDGTFDFKDKDTTVPPEGTNKYVVVFTPDKTDRYKTLEQEISVTVTSSGGSGGGNGGGVAQYINDSSSSATEPPISTTQPAATTVPNVIGELPSPPTLPVQPVLPKPPAVSVNEPGNANSDPFANMNRDKTAFETMLETALKSQNPTVQFDSSIVKANKKRD